MAATILDGNVISAAIRAELAEEVKELSAGGLRPGLAAGSGWTKSGPRRLADLFAKR